MGLVLEQRHDGSTLLRQAEALPAYPVRVTDKLAHWAAVTPDATFLAERAGHDWHRLSYRDAWRGARAIGQALLDRGLSAERPVLILSGNGIDHALLALGCQLVGVPYAPISVAYSLASQDLAKLRGIVALTTPGLVFAAGPKFARAFAALPEDTERLDSIETLLRTVPTDAVDRAMAAVGPDTLAKFLFTSGSTGSPKGVITTQRMLCSNQAMLAGVFPFVVEEPPVMLCWLPWSHTFGGSHNFNLVLFNGGTLYIDAGRPVPGQFEPTVAALREIAPTLHLVVPKGWEELALRLRADPALNKQFHSRLRVTFYAAASLPQPLWEELERLSVEATGRVLPMLTGYGATETAPAALGTDGEGGGQAGYIGGPLLGVEAKLVPVDGKLEVRLRGPNITPGYWREPAKTAESFDDEGFYCTGDAVAWVDPARPEAGLKFDGRLAEDFKLLTGTWVSVGPLRARLIAAMAPYVREIVVAGHDRDWIAVLAIPYDRAVATDPAVNAQLQAVLNRLAAEAQGSSARVMRMAWLADALSIDAGEATDKGSVNQRAVLKRRGAEVAALYAEQPGPGVLCVEMVSA
jgi:feruloyl-CoA synthase